MNEIVIEMSKYLNVKQVNLANFLYFLQFILPLVRS